MFLVELNEHERKIFLELAYHAMSSDGQIQSEEQEVFQSYAYECEMPEYRTENVELPALIASAKNFTKRKRRILMLELWGMILADDQIEESEAQWMDQISQEMGFNSAQGRRIRRWAKDFLDIIGDGYRLIEGV